MSWLWNKKGTACINPSKLREIIIRRRGNYAPYYEVVGVINWVEEFNFGYFGNYSEAKTFLKDLGV